MTKSEFILLEDYLGPVPLFLKKYLNLSILVRLKDISMLCGVEYANHLYKYNNFYISRYNHSYETALITWRLTHNKKYTLAALFHDVASPVFSHVIDFLNNDYEKQESTEKMTMTVLKYSFSLENFLKEDGLSISDIADYKQYSVVDNKRPKLCADRFDNVLIVAIGWLNLLSLDKAKMLVDNLMITTNSDNEEEIGFKSMEAALLYLKINDEINKNIKKDEDGYFMGILKDIVAILLKKNYVTYEQLYKFTEEEIFLIIEYYLNYDKELEELYNKFKHTTELPLDIQNKDLKKDLLIP